MSRVENLIIISTKISALLQFCSTAGDRAARACVLTDKRLERSSITVILLPSSITVILLQRHQRPCLEEEEAEEAVAA